MAAARCLLSLVLFVRSRCPKGGNFSRAGAKPAAWVCFCFEKARNSRGIDELGYLNLKPEQSNIFFKLMKERYRQHSTIITTNLVYDEWPNFLGARPMVEALLSRLRHYCHTVTIDGPSLRDLQG